MPKTHLLPLPLRPSEIDGISLAEGQYKIEGAGILLYLSAFTAKETEVTVNWKGEDVVFTVYNVNGTEPEITTADLYLLNAKALAEDNAKMFVHAWGDGMSDQEVEMSILKEGNDTLGFSAKINKLAEYIIFVRMNGKAESIDWFENWGKTDALDRCANDSMYFHGWTAVEGIFDVKCEAPLTETVFTVVVPAATDSVFIVGDFTDWNFVKMSLVEGEDSIYTYTAEGDVRSMGYKYAAGPDWKYEESNQSENRTYTVRDTVLSFKAVPVEPATGIDSTQSDKPEGNEAQKVLIDGVTYIILPDGGVINTQGTRVK